MSEQPLKYVVIVVKDAKDVKPTVEFADLKIEYVVVGTQFIGRHFRGVRPTHVIDRTKIQGWYEYFYRLLGDDIQLEVE